MAKIPLYKFAQKEYPLTPKSTINYWAILAYEKKQGPLANMVERIGGRWYVNLPGDPVTERILTQVRDLLHPEKK